MPESGHHHKGLLCPRSDKNLVTVNDDQIFQFALQISTAEILFVTNRERAFNSQGYEFGCRLLYEHVRRGNLTALPMVQNDDQLSEHWPKQTQIELSCFLFTSNNFEVKNPKL